MASLQPLDPPYDETTAAWLARWVPPGIAVEPLAVFRTLAVHRELADRMRPLGAALLAHGLLPARDRELLIARVTARAGAGYEWGVHATVYAGAVGLEEAALLATAGIGSVDGAADELLVRAADELHDAATLSAPTWAALAERYSPEQVLELLTLCGWYRLLSGVITSVGLAPEPWARPYPA